MASELEIHTFAQHQSVSLMQRLLNGAVQIDISKKLFSEYNENRRSIFFAFGSAFSPFPTFRNADFSIKDNKKNVISERH